MTPMTNSAGTPATDSGGLSNIPAHQQLEQLQQAIGQLAFGFAHDFNNLLGIIVGNLDLVEPFVASNVIAAKRISIVGETAARGTELTHRLLLFSNDLASQSLPAESSASIQKMIELATHALLPGIIASAKRDGVLTSGTAERAKADVDKVPLRKPPQLAKFYTEIRKIS
jgi:signal transduction histidine kinase